MTQPDAIEVRSRTLGLATPPSPLDCVWLVPPAQKITLAELIAATVAEQVRELLARRRLQAAEAIPILRRQYMTPSEISAQAAQGAVRYPSPRRAQAPELDPAVEVERAWRAFEAGAYFVYVDGRRVTDLAEEVVCEPGARVTFLRLMPLRGG